MTRLFLWTINKHVRIPTINTLRTKQKSTFISIIIPILGRILILNFKNMWRIILVSIALTLAHSNSCRAQDREVLQVVGKAIFLETPENYVLQIDLIETDTLYERCSRELLNKLELLQEELSSKGLQKEQISTQDLSMAEQFEFRDGKRIKIGYIGTVRLTIEDKYSPKKLGSVIQVPEKYQVTYRLIFALSDQQKDSLSEKAIKAAVEDARSKAELIAAASGVKLVKISKINYEASNFGDYRLIQEAEVAHKVRDFGNELDLSPKAISIRKAVDIEWQIAN